MLPAPQLSADQRKLLKLYESLCVGDRGSLLAFAEFLASRQRSDDTTEGMQEPATAVPRQIPRPAKESVVAAIKRLSSSYFMLDSRAMLDDTASLMSAHILHGRRADKVIDDLEELFQEHYRRYRSTDSD
jgi:hypothetical protein